MSKLTGDIVFAEVITDDFAQRKTLGEFGFQFNIVGKLLDGYKFTVMRFAHDITLYPVQFFLDSQLGEELRIKTSANQRYIKKIEDPDKLEEFLKSVLTSKRIRDVIGAILKLSK